MTLKNKKILMEKNKNILSESKEREILLKYFPQGIIAFDLETTGLSPSFDNIVEISAIKISNEGDQVFSTLVRPLIEIPQKVIDIHGITNEMVEDAPDRGLVLKDFKHFIKSTPLLAHNALFDISFIAQNYTHLDFTFSPNPVYCSLKFSRKVFSKFISHKLSFLVEKLGIPLENHHRAYDDALACLRIFCQGLNRLEEEDCGEKKIQRALKGSYQLNLKDFNAKSFHGTSTHHNTLKKSLRDDELIEIKYNGGSQKNQFRPIRPISLIPRPQGLCLYAHCLQSDLFKFYLLKKIPDIRKLNKADKDHWNKKLKTRKEKN
jgi:DNA polymerase III epsilon subunit family exonuclease